MAKDDGGPAFPSPTANQSQHGQLSVRDYFAGQALQAALAAHADGYQQYDLDTIAETVYMVADAMLAERAK